MRVEISVTSHVQSRLYRWSTALLSKALRAQFINKEFGPNIAIVYIAFVCPLPGDGEPELFESQCTYKPKGALDLKKDTVPVGANGVLEVYIGLAWAMIESFHDDSEIKSYIIKCLKSDMTRLLTNHNLKEFQGEPFTEKVVNILSELPFEFNFERP